MYLKISNNLNRSLSRKCTVTFSKTLTHWFLITWLWFFSSVGATIARCKDPVRRAPRAPTERSKENFNGTRYILFFPRRCVAPLLSLSLSLSLCHEKVHVSWQTSALTVCRVHQDKSRWLEATGARWGKGYKKKKKKQHRRLQGRDNEKFEVVRDRLTKKRGREREGLIVKSRSPRVDWKTERGKQVRIIKMENL